MQKAEFYNNRALPEVNMGVNITDSLELEIIADPLNDAFNAYEEEERKKQIDAFTAIMREKSERIAQSNILEGSTTNLKPTLKPKQGKAEGTGQPTSTPYNSPTMSASEEHD